jgi:deoxyribonuclease IV
VRLGVHIRIAKGLLDGAAQAESLACETVQMFSSNPNAWSTSALDPVPAAAFAARITELGIHPVTLHTPYLVNLASPDATIWRNTVQLLSYALARADLMRAHYVVTHIGSHKGTGYEEGVVRIRLAIHAALEASPGTAMLLLEAGAGAGNTIGSKFHELAHILDGVNDPERVGIALDTAHLWAAGYDLHTPEAVRSTLEEFDRHVGLPRLKLLHLNDTERGLDSHVDLHWHIGQGQIGTEGFRTLLNYPGFDDLPGIIETPGRDMEHDSRNLELLKSLRE